jgi:hypothetical protein
MRSNKIYLWILLYMVAPILSVVVAATIAKATGSRLDEGDSHPCFVLGIDIGGLLYDMGVAGLFALITIPTGLIAIVVTYLVRVFWKRRAKGP